MRSLWAGVVVGLAVPFGAAFAQPVAVRELALVDGVLPVAQRLIVAKQGDVQRWRLTSNLPGEVHVHAYRVSVTLQPGQAGELAFTAHASGRFRVEWHAAGAASTSSAAHHAPALAVLEVRPR